MLIICCVLTSAKKIEYMNRFWTTVTIIILLLVFVGYMVFDLAFKKEKVSEVSEVSAPAADSVPNDKWSVDRIFDPGKGKLQAVATLKNGGFIVGGASFLASYDKSFLLQWNSKTEMDVSAIAVHSDKIYAAFNNTIEVFNMKGENLEEWGPYDDKSIITSISANDSYVVFADAAGKTIYVLDKEGEVKYLVGKEGEPFIIPSSYFDVVIGNDNTLYVANTGNRRIERRTIDGTMIDNFGEAGLAPGAFCGCCNPAHFALFQDEFITAEKGINRIKILSDKGEFIEFVSSVNDFLPPVPLDIAVSPDGSMIYGANPADSKLYIFKRE
jgi:DNA-binding beta-propeller fold protein YncE